MKRKTLFIGVILIILLAFGVSKFSDNGKNDSNLATTTPVFDDSKPVVRVTGKLKPAESVNLAFSRGGRIASVLKSIGQTVGAGEVLAELDTSELQTQLLEASAAFQAEQSKLAEIELGTRPEELAVAETKVTNAETALADSKVNLKDKIIDAYTRSDNAIRNTVDQFFSNPRSSNPELNFLISDQQLQINLKSKRPVVESLLLSWSANLTTVSVVLVKDYLNQIKSFLDLLALAINALTPTSTLSQTTIDGYKTDMSEARISINTAISNLITAEEKYRSAESSLALEKNELLLKQAGSLPEAREAQKAKVRQAEAKVETIRAQIRNSRIVAPFFGVVSRQDAKVGEVAIQNTALISLISANRLEIEANVPEVDIGDLRVGNMAKIDFDAFLGEEFTGKVISIEPAETLLDGVVNFKIKIGLDKPDVRFKSGLTANIEISS